jgi:hypothetical protein
VADHVFDTGDYELAWPRELLVGELTALRRPKVHRAQMWCGC